MSAKTKAKRDRRPYASALDMRDALLDFHRAMAEADERRPLPFRFKDARVASPSAVAALSWEMTAIAERLRAAARRMLVAQYGARAARRFDGWRRPRAATN